MKAGMWVAIATGMVISVAPAQLEAQGASQRARAEQRERQDERARERQEQQRRAAERERLRTAGGTVRAGVIRPREIERNQRRNERDRYDERSVHRNPAYGVQRTQGQGPAFCRSGEGHPVFGRQWCLDKGFGLGNDRSMRNGRDDRDYDIWRDIILSQPRDRRYDRSLNRSMLQELIGPIALASFESYGRQYGNGAVTGRWLDNRGTVLELLLGGAPIARLTDTNRDGRVDRVQLRR